MRISDWSSDVCSSDLNLALGFTLFICLLVVLTSSMMLPMTFLGPLQSYRPLQMAPIGLIVALPQLVLGSVVALFLYRKWVDARFVFAGGLLLIALACFSGAQLTSDWNRDQFVIAQTLQAFGQRTEERRVGKEGVRTCKSRW